MFFVKYVRFIPLVFIFLFEQQSTLNAQTYLVNSTNNNVLFTTCTGDIYDSGGSGANYTNNQDFNVRFDGGVGNTVRLTFVTFNTEATNDIVRIYNSNGTSGTLLGTYSGTTLPPVINSTGRYITVRFTSNAATTRAGFRITLSCISTCTEFTSGGSITSSTQNVCGNYDPSPLTNVTLPSGGSGGTTQYQWQLNDSGSWTDIAGATSADYDPPTAISVTTQYRRNARRCTGSWVSSNIITKTVSQPFTVSVGADITQCYNSAFRLSGTAPQAGQTASWSVISGSAFTTYATDNDSIIYSLSSGNTATIRYTVTNGICSSSDDIVITNSTACTPTCTSPINYNGDLEDEGGATNFNLTFQGTPAQLITSTNTIPGWGQGYGGAIPNNTTFYGAYYLKKTGVAGHPRSGTHMAYIGGAGGYCLITYNTNSNLNCGRKFKFSAWIAAYSNGPTQNNSVFDIEFFAGGDAVPPANIDEKMSLIAPASTSWNNLNWQRYEYIITLPDNGYNWANFVFTPTDNINGIVVDDVCITEMESGSYADAGPDIYACASTVNMAANTPFAGYTGTWTVANGSATIASPNSPTSSITITSGSTATLNWTVSNGSCSTTDNVVVSYITASPISVNNAAICPGGAATLTATGCSGNILWSNGATTTSINVSPASTTTYTVTCTPIPSSNLALNPGFESTTNFQNWGNWGGSGITTVAGEFRSGTKGAKVDGISNWAGFGQDIAVSPGDQIVASFWVKSNITQINGGAGIQFVNSSWNVINSQIYQRAEGSGWKKYTVTGIAPPGAAYVQPYAFSYQGGIIYVDDVEVYKSTGCTRIASGTVDVATSIPTITTTTPNSRCGTGVVTLGATSSGGTINWYTVATGGTSIATGTSYATPSISTTTTYYVDATQGGCTTPTRTAVIATINAIPTITGTTPNSRCGTGTVTLGATSSGGTINWYTVATGGTSINTGTNYTTPSISATTTYYVDATQNGCTTASRTAVIATINAIPTITGTTPASRCGTGTVTLGATSSGGTINWYTVATGGTSIGTGTSYTTPSISATATYYVDATQNGCTTASRTAVIATINAIPTITGTTPASRCGTGTVTLGATSSGGTLNWYTVATGGTSINTGTNYTTPSISATTMYYVDATQNGCTTASRTAIIATINAIPTITGTTPADRCGTGTVTLSATSSGGTINWYTVATGGTSIITGTNYTTPSISATTTYYVDATQNGCTTASRTAVIATINAIPTITGTTPASRCGTGTVTLGATSSGGTINWYTVATGGTSINTGTNYTTPSISATTTYYVDATQNGCTTASRTAVIATINAIPTITGTTPASRCGTGTVTLGATSSGGIINWYTVATGGTSINTGTSYTTPSILATTTYYVDATQNSCTSAIRTAVTATIIDLPVLQSSTPASRCGSGQVTLEVSFNVGTINWYDSPTGGSSLGTGNSFTTPNISTTTTYYVDATHNGCTISPRIPITASINTNWAITGTTPGSRCGTGSVVLGATSNGGTINWYASSSGGAVLNSGLTFNTPIIAATTTYYVEISGGSCLIAGRIPIVATVHALPNASISGNTNICNGTFTILTAQGAGTYQWSNGQAQNAILVNSAGSFTVTVTNGAGCTNSASVNVSFLSSPSVSIDYFNNVCLNDTSKLKALTTNGTSPYLYSWVGPSSFVGNSEIVNITNNGNYYITVTDANGCSATANGFVYQRYEPYIVNLGTEVCEGQSVNLQAISPTAVSYLWSANAGNATTASVSVNPQFPSSTYTVTITNDLGCKTAPQIIITAKQKPTVNIAGSNEICIGSTTILNPSVGGTWSSSNPTVAVINNSGVVTGVNIGSATFTFTNSSTGCVSDPSLPVTVKSKPSVSITGPTGICVGDTSYVSPTSGGTWQSLNPTFASVSNNGRVIGLAEGAARFLFTNAVGCVSDTTAVILVSSSSGVVINGASQVCVQSSITLTPSLGGGVWSSSNPLIATVSAAGLVTGISSGTVTITYTNTTGTCSFDATKIITVNPIPQTAFTGNNTICQGDTTLLSPTMGGTWSSSNPTVATITNDGKVTGLSGGAASFTFANTATGCVSVPSSLLTVLPKPNGQLLGPSEICVGSQTTFIPVTGGTWTSSNPLVATISNAGVVIGISSGIAKFLFTATGGCVSDSTVAITVNSKPSLVIDYFGSVCLTDSSKLSVITSNGTPSFNYIWSGPSGFGASTKTINIYTSGNYFLTVTDSKGCSANISAFIHQKYEPYLSSFNNSICEGQSVNLNVNASNVFSYLWSPNAGSAIGPSVTVLPSMPASTYTVTVTSGNGCVVALSATINVNSRPSITILGPSGICVSNTTSLFPSTGGVWVSSNPSVASINNSGIVAGITPGSSTFTYTDNSTGCSSNPSTPINVFPNITTGIVGPNTICKGDTTQLSPASGGFWVSNTPAIASVTSSGSVKGLSQGIASFSFTTSNGCVIGNTQTINVNGLPNISLNGEDSICAGTNTFFLPNIGGTWSANHPSIATISTNGIVTGISEGIATFRFTDNAGCKSDTSTAITIMPVPVVSITGLSEICLGSTTSLSPVTGGIWISSAPAVATVSSTGIVTSLNTGQATFRYINLITGCTSQPTQPITIHPRRLISVQGSNNLCIGDSLTVSSSGGIGYWTSSDPAVAFVSNGKVTGLTPGNVTISFIDTITGCSSINNLQFTVFAKPTTSLIGPSNLCLGSSSSILPATGGVWTSSNSAIASITNNGVISALSAGSVKLVFTQNGSGCKSDSSVAVTVIPAINPMISGPDTICVGSTTTLSPSSGGAWISLNNAVATVNANGVVTGVSNGPVWFRFTDAFGCQSTLTDTMTIVNKPTIILAGPNSICIGGNTYLQTFGQGSWVSSNPLIATIDQNGIISGITAGTAKFVFHSSATGCRSDSSTTITVNPFPEIVLLGSPNLCTGATTNVIPSVDGIWSSSNPSVATVNNTGLVTAISPGITTLNYILFSTGCAAQQGIQITVHNNPSIGINSPTTICVGYNTTLFPSTGGTWTSQNNAVATTTSNGVVTGISQGNVKFNFVSSSTGCTATTTQSVIVNPSPSINLAGQASICIGGNTQFLPNSGGTWESLNPSVATISNSGLVLGIASGTATFRFRENGTGCYSVESTPISVTNPIPVSVVGATDVCVGYTTLLSPASGGVWRSSNDYVASVTSSGLVKGIAPGKVSFYFTETSSGCISSLPANAVTIIQCIDPDFGVTMKNVPLNGDVAVNDEGPGDRVYQSPFLNSKPAGSIATLIVNADGSYNFVADKEGKYKYHIPVCMLPDMDACPVSLLEITVIDPYNVNRGFVSNVDFGTVYRRGSIGKDTSLFVKSKVNDKCVNTITCDLSSLVINNRTSSGNLISGNYQTAGFNYIPPVNSTGKDTLFYGICNSTGACDSTITVITVNDTSANNSVVALDDFFAVPKGMIISGNVLANDMDPESDLLSTDIQGTPLNPVVLSSGAFYLLTNGEFSFVPNPGFIGNVHIPYNVCDNNPIPTCSNATLQLMVIDHFRIQIRTYLEGALLENSNAKGSHNRPLMRDDIRLNPVTGNNDIPTTDPYTSPTQYTDITAMFTKVGPGDNPAYQTITNPATVFSVSGENAIVDWIFVELRSKSNPALIVATRSGLLQRDGDIVDIDGSVGLAFPGIFLDSFYVVVKHRNHLGAMTNTVPNNVLVDFTNNTTPIFNFGTTRINGVDFTGLSLKYMEELSVYALWGGDFDANGKVKFTSPFDDQAHLFVEVLDNPLNTDKKSNFNIGYGYYQGDFNLNGKVKFDNPNDDKNLLFLQIIFYPLNIDVKSNYNNLIQQVVTPQN